VSRVLLILASITAAVAATARPAAAQSDDHAEIRSVAMRQADTWNRHDAKAYAALFTEDCDVVNVLGWWWKGRAEVERKLTQAFRFMFRDSRLTITEVHTRFLRPEVAITHARWTMVGARNSCRNSGAAARDSNAGLCQAVGPLVDLGDPEYSRHSRRALPCSTRRS
jgi:uncharacterized protein (TIGR02246 family)